MPDRFDIAMQRNEDFGCTVEITGPTGERFDITGWTFEMEVRERVDNSDLIQSATIEIIDAPGGMLGIELQGPGAALGSYGDPLLTYELPYDLIGTDSLGHSVALLAGYVSISRGVS